MSRVLNKVAAEAAWLTREDGIDPRGEQLVSIPVKLSEIVSQLRI